MFAIPEQTVMSAVAVASSARCAKTSREADPSGTQRAE
jgi:hypothetical protein